VYLQHGKGQDKKGNKKTGKEKQQEPDQQAGVGTKYRNALSGSHYHPPVRSLYHSIIFFPATQNINAKETYSPQIIHIALRKNSVHTVSKGDESNG
jgi:hypothetical protein